MTGLPAVYLVTGISLLLFLLLVILSGFRAIAHLVAYIYPGWRSLQVLNAGDRDEDTLWLSYWVIYGFFTVLESITDLLKHRIPLYELVKMGFYLYLYEMKGALVVYERLLRPLVINAEAFRVHTKTHVEAAESRSSTSSKNYVAESRSSVGSQGYVEPRSSVSSQGYVEPRSSVGSQAYVEPRSSVTSKAYIEPRSSVSSQGQGQAYVELRNSAGSQGYTEPRSSVTIQGYGEPRSSVSSQGYVERPKVAVAQDNISAQSHGTPYDTTSTSRNTNIRKVD